MSAFRPPLAEAAAAIRRLSSGLIAPSDALSQRATAAGKATTRTVEVSRFEGMSIKGRAAVLVPLFVDEAAPGGLSVLLTKRPASLATHSGEVCFPGGKAEPADTDDTCTALRESEEEIGLKPEQVTVIKHLPAAMSKHGLSVRPIVGLIPTNFIESPQTNPQEVETVFAPPLHEFLSSKNHRHQDVDWRGRRFRIHYFDCLGHEVWGLTAGILIEVAMMAFGKRPEFDVHPPQPHTGPSGMDSRASRL